MKVYTIKQASSRCGVSEKTIRRAITAGKLKAEKRGEEYHSRLYISDTELDRYKRVSKQKKASVHKVSEKVDNIIIPREVWQALQGELEQLHKAVDQQQRLTLDLQARLPMLQAPVEMREARESVEVQATKEAKPVEKAKTGKRKKKSRRGILSFLFR